MCAVGVYVLLSNGYPGKVGETRIPLAELMSLESGGSIESTCVISPVQPSILQSDEQCAVPHHLLQCEEQVYAFPANIIKCMGDIMSITHIIVMVSYNNLFQEHVIMNT